MEAKLLAEICSNILEGKVVSLDLTNQNVQEHDLKFIAAAIESRKSQILKIVLDDNNLFSSEGFRVDGGFSKFLIALQYLPNLIYLSLNNVHMTGSALKALGHLLASNKLNSIQSLYLQNNNFSVEHFTSFASVVTQCPNLQTLNIDDNTIGDEGCISLAQGLKTNSNILSLSLANVGLTNVGMQALASVLEYNTCLQVLQVSENAIGDMGAIALASLLNFTHTLRQIHLSNCKVSKVGAAAIFEVLEKNSTLRKLNLSNNYINDLSVLPNIIKYNKTLECINLSNNLLNCQAIINVFKMIPFNQVLKELDLEGNSISDIAAIELAKFLPANDSLLRINLAHNFITVQGAESILEASKLHEWLQDVILHDNLFAANEVEHLVVGRQFKRIRYVLESNLENIDSKEADMDEIQSLADNEHHGLRPPSAQLFF